MVHPRGAVISPERLLTDEIGRGIMRVRRLILTEAGKRLEPQGDSVLAWQALNLLDRLGPVPQGALAEGLGQHAPGISWGRNRLDRRVVVVSLARRGKTRLEADRPLMEAAVERVLAPLDQTDRRALRNLLWRMIPQK